MSDVDKIPKLYEVATLFSGWTPDSLIVGDSDILSLRVNESPSVHSVYTATWTHYYIDGEICETLEFDATGAPIEYMFFDDNKIMQERKVYAGSYDKGERRIYNEKGSLYFNYSFEGGKQHGLHTVYYDSGQVMQKTPYQFGKRHGESLHFDSQGSVIIRNYFEKDEMVGWQLWYAENEKAGFFMKDGKVTSRTGC